MEDVIRVISKAIIISIVIVSDTLIKDCCRCLKRHTSLICTSVGHTGGVSTLSCFALSLYEALIIAAVTGRPRALGAGVCLMGIHVKEIAK